MLSPGVRRAAIAALLLLTIACQSLDLQNPNAPDREQVVTSGEDVTNLVAGGTNNWLRTGVGGCLITLATMADQMSAPWNNFEIRRMSAEPRESFDNTPQGSEVVNFFWDLGYASLLSANLALLALEAGLEIGPDGADNAMIEATARFLQGANLATVALLYDKAYIIDEHNDLAFPPFAEPAAVRDAALQRLDQAIAIAVSNDFTLPNGFFNHPGWTSKRLAQLANTLAARTIAYFGRTKVQNAAQRWDRVLQYARGGISSPGAAFDPTQTGDNDRWYDETKAWTNDPADGGGSVRMDQALVCRMDPTQPCRFPATGFLPPPQGADQRMSGPSPDFTYYSSPGFLPGRGRERFSHVGQIRYQHHEKGLGDVPFLLAAENDLLIAEALIRTGGSHLEAAILINQTRVVRGGLPALTGTEGDQVLFEALFYERDVELYASAMGAPYYDARRTDRLQPLTPRQLPVPGDELSLRGEPIYTFGGADNPDFAPPSSPGASTWSPVNPPRVPYRGGVLQANPRLFAKVRAARLAAIGGARRRD